MSDQSVLQVVVDPTGAEQGSSRVESAIGRMSDKSTDFLKKMSDQFQSLEDFITKTTNSFSGFMKTLIAIDAIKSLIDRMIDVNLVYNQFVATMRAVTGSMDSAKREFQYITDYSNKMGASIEDIAKIYGRLAAALRQFDGTGEITRHIFEGVAQAQSVLHAKGYETNGIFLAFEQIVSKSKLSLEEVQKQLGNRLPNAMGLAAESMGMSQQKFREAITKGSIDPLEFVIKLAQQIKLQYGSAATEAADMFNGQMMRMKNAIFSLYLAVGQSGALNGLTDIVKTLTGLLNDPSVGKQFGQSVGQLFSQIAGWLATITKQDVQDFFDGFGLIIQTLVTLMRELTKSFSDTVDGKADFIAFADAVASGLLVVSDVALTVVAAIRAIPLELEAAWKGTQRIATFANPNSTKEQRDQADAEWTKAYNASSKNEDILFGTEDSPVAKAWARKDAMFAKLQAQRASTGGPSFSDARFEAGAGLGQPLSAEDIARLSANGPGAPGNVSKRDVFNTESTSLAKADALAVLEYNNAMSNKIKLEDKNRVALEAKIATDKDYKALSESQLTTLRALAAQVDRDQLSAQASIQYSSQLKAMNEQEYASKQQLRDIQDQLNPLEEKNQRLMIEKMNFDPKFIAMSADMKVQLINRAAALDTLAVAIDNATKVEKSRYETLVDTLQVERDMSNMESGLGTSKYDSVQKLLDSFETGGANQFADMQTKSKLWADALQKDLNAANRDMETMKFNEDNLMKDQEFQLSLIGKTAIERQKLTAVYNAEKQIRMSGIDLSKDENAKWVELVEVLRGKVSTAYDDLARHQADLGEGFKSGLASYIDQVSNFAKQMEDSVVRAFGKMEDALVKFVMTGKLNFHDLVNSIISDITRIAVREQITQPLANWLNGAAGNAGNALNGAGALSNGLGWMSDFGGSVANVAQRGMNYFSGTPSVVSNGWTSAEGGSSYVSTTASSIGQMAQTAGAIASYASALNDLKNGQYASAAGTAIGQYFGGPIGAFIGNKIGSWVDSQLSGETRGGAQYGYKFDGQDLYNNRRGSVVGNAASGVNVLEGPSGGELASGDVRKAISGAVDTINGYLKGLGSSATLTAFQAGLETSEKGRGGVFAGGALSTGASFGLSGRGDNYAGTLFDKAFTTSPDAKTALTNFMLDLKQTTVEALQAATDIPKAIADQLKNVDVKKLTDDQASSLLASIGAEIAAVNQFRDALGVLPPAFVNLKNLSFDAADGLIKAAGGVQSLQSGISYFAQNFYTDAEKTAGAQADLTKQLASLGYAGITTKEQFRAIEEGLDLNTAAGQQTYATLLKIAPKFVQISDAADQAAQAVIKAAQDQAAGTLKALQDGATQRLTEASNAVSAAFSTLQNSVQAQKDLLTKAHQDEIAGLNDGIKSISTAISGMQRLAQSLHTAVERSALSLDPAVDRSAAQAQVMTALAIARAGGALPDADQLSGALNTLAQSSESLFSTAEDYQRDRASTSINLTELEQLTGKQISDQQRGLDALQQQIAIADAGFTAEMLRLDAIIGNAQQQIDLLNGIEHAALSIPAAIAALGAALNVAKAAQIGAPTSNGSISAPINSLYQSVLGRAPDAEGAAYWQKQMMTLNWSWTDFQKAFLTSATVTGGSDASSAIAYARANGIPGFASGGDFGGGAALVGEVGPEIINTGPARVFSARQTASMLRGTDNADVVAELRALRAEVTALRATSARIADHAGRTADAMEGDQKQPLLVEIA